MRRSDSLGARFALVLGESEVAAGTVQVKDLRASTQVELPVVFKRLFSDAALEAGDLLTGREREVDDVRRILLGEAPGVPRHPTHGSLTVACRARLLLLSPPCETASMSYRAFCAACRKGWYGIISAWAA